MSSPSPRSPPALAIGLAALLLFAWRATSYGLLADDAFITFRHADHLARGLGLTYNPGQSVEGTSSLMWALLLAGGSRMGLAPPDLAPVLGVLSGALCLAVVYAAARRILGCPRGAAFAALVILAQNPSFAFWSASGMETPAFALLVVAAWALMHAPAVEHARGAVLLAGVAALLGLARPEGLAAAVLVPVGLFARRVDRRPLLVATGLLWASVAAVIVWRWGVYGALLPNPVYAKMGLTTLGVLRGLAYLWAFLRDDGVVWLVPLMLFARCRRGPVASLVGIVLGYAGLVVLAGGDGLYRYRLMAHVMPCLVLVVADGLGRLWDARPRWALGSSVLVVGAIVAPLFDPGFFRAYTVQEVRDWEERWDQVGRALRASVPPDAVLATNVAGRVPYRSKLYTIDLLGLNDATIARSSVRELGKGYAGHERADPDYVLRRRPDVIYFSVLDGMPPGLSCSVRANRTVLARGSLFRYAALFDDREFVRGYAPAEMVLASGERATLIVRRDLRVEPERGERLSVGRWCDVEGAGG
jgi:arabinofuranosyltransferase